MQLGNRLFTVEIGSLMMNNIKQGMYIFNIKAFFKEIIRLPHTTLEHFQ